MPAPTQLDIQENIKQAMLAQGYGKQSYGVNDKIITSPTELTKDMEKLVVAIAVGINQTWVAWQAAQIVTIPATGSPGAPSAGILP